jgi:hypothetical protein
MEYLTGKGAANRLRNAPIDGGIIQAPVSDRDALRECLSKEAYERSVEVAKDWIGNGKGEDVLPAEVTKGLFGSPCSARRWLSLASPEHEGEDDYFSPGLSDEKLRGSFGQLGVAKTPLCILYSGSDEFVAKDVDKKALVERWVRFVREGMGVVDDRHSGIVEGATHNLKGDPEEVVKDLIARVTAFLKRIEEGNWNDVSDKEKL